LIRVEHWDNAQALGRHAGRCMAGADEPFTYLPFFFSDLFDFGYEAVGEVDSRLDTEADWQDEFETGVIYYHRDGKLRGALMCNVWDRVDAARKLIQSGATVTGDNLPDLDAAAED
jgi:NADPH-dependent 2,4-dienoyl-CoA reductase/sulfur reductase-like enzyme